MLSENWGYGRNLKFPFKHLLGISLRDMRTPVLPEKVPRDPITPWEEGHQTEQRQKLHEPVSGP